MSTVAFEVKEKSDENGCLFKKLFLKTATLGLST